jgi:hypothetical protein
MFTAGCAGTTPLRGNRHAGFGRAACSKSREAGGQTGILITSQKHIRGTRVVFKLFSPSKIDEFAKSLAQDIAKRYPPAIANNPQQMVSQKRLTDILEETFAKAATFQQENSLGWYKKAKLGNEFRWELKEMGYDEKFIEMATEGLIVYVTRASK